MSREPEHFRQSARPVTVAAVQMACGWDRQANIARAERLVRAARVMLPAVSQSHAI